MHPGASSYMSDLFLLQNLYFVQEFHGQGLVGRALGDAEAVIVQNALVEGVGHLGTVFGHHVEAAVPARDHVDLAVLHQLGMLGAGRPPHGNVRFEFLDFLDGAFNAAGRGKYLIHLGRRHAVCHQRRLERTGHTLAVGALAGEFLDIPEIGPALRTLFTIGLGVPGQHIGEDIAADAELLRQTGRES